MPRNRKATIDGRAAFSLDATANRHPATTKRRDACYDAFCSWVLQQLGVRVSDGGLPQQDLTTALIAFGRRLFYTGAPKYFFAETINSVVDHFPGCRHMLSSAWAVLRK